ncbi:MAG TPA: hypothetical protein VK171_04885 [Fimbriimonas sp.]|nr:hypothetical protein [Fimbriimonas sp.]
MRYALGFVVLCLAIAGCSKPGIVGKWKGSGPGGNGEIITEFKGDNTHSSTITASQGGVELVITSSGTYKAEAEKITMTITDFKIDESKLDAQTKKLMPLIKTALDEQKNKPSEGTFKLEDDGNSLNITGAAAAGMVGKFTRVK